MSSQRNNSFRGFFLGEQSYVGCFMIEDGTVDGVSTTDGIAITLRPSPRFPEDFLVVQDDLDETSVSEDRKTQKQKVVDWRDIRAGLSTLP